MWQIGVDPTKVSDTDDFGVGMIGTGAGSAFKLYKWVQYDTGAGGVAAAANNACYYYTVDGYKNSQVTSDVTDSSGVGAGVLQSAPTDGQYCWIQIKGPATLATSLSGGGDGDALTAVGASDGTLDVSALVTDAIVAYAGDHSDDEIICDFPM